MDRPRSILRTVCVQFAWNCVGGVAVGALIAFSRPGASLSALAGDVLVGTIYANCIGLPIALIMHWIGPRLAGLSRPAKLGIEGGVVLAMWGLGTLLATVALLPLGLDPGWFWAEFAAGMRITLVVGLVVCGVGIGFAALRNRLGVTERALREQELAASKAEEMASRAQLAALEARVRPHFLFNTLNTIAALIPTEPARAEEIVDRLASLLRYSLDLHPGGLVPLADELDVVADYLAIEAARFGDRLSYEVDVADELARVEVPPFCVQTLVENSIKHVVARRRGPTRIRVGASGNADAVSIEVRDDGPGVDATALAAGRGLHNLEQRLAAVFGNAAALAIGGGPGAQVAIRVPRRSPA